MRKHVNGFVSEMLRQGQRTLNTARREPLRLVDPRHYLGSGLEIARATLTGSDDAGDATTAAAGGIPSLVEIGRKLGAFGTFSLEPHAAIDPETFVMASNRVQSETTADSLASIVRAMWRLEALAFALVRGGGGLRDGLASPEVRPIAHVGIGMAVVEQVGFDRRRLARLVGARAAADHAGYCWEGLGAMLAVQTRPRMRSPTDLMGQLGLDLMKVVEPPRRLEEFTQQFDGDERRLLGHGYGRTMYLTADSVDAALEETAEAPPFERESLVQGIAFAFAMVNHRDLPSVLGRVASVTTALRAAFADGVEYALQLAEWTRPGFLPRLAESSGEPLVARADARVRELRATGRTLPAFNPR